MKTKKAALAAGHCRSHLLRFECCTLGYEGWMPDAEHDGISMSNFTIGKKKENSSVAFGKVAVGNELLGIAFFRSDAHQSYKEAGSETCVSGYTQASLSRPARLVSLAMQQSCRLHW